MMLQLFLDPPSQPPPSPHHHNHHHNHSSKVHTEHVQLVRHDSMVVGIHETSRKETRATRWRGCSRLETSLKLAAKRLLSPFAFLFHSVFLLALEDNQQKSKE